jgi:DNA (cytosine-5)-methyltransferase 1
VNEKKPTVGSLFAGIAGFDLGFEQAGFETKWQVEINPLNRAVLGHRFPHARQFEDVCTFDAQAAGYVDCLTAGFPCQDISNAGSSRKGKRPGLSGKRSGLFWQVIRVAREIRPEWLVLENVEALLYSRGGKDFETVIGDVDECGYGMAWRVLDAAHFGSPARRRRLFLVGRLGGMPPESFLHDASPVEAVPSAFSARSRIRAKASWPGHTLQAVNSSCRISIGSELLVAEENRWSAMVERGREVEDHGLPAGMDFGCWHKVYAAGNSVSVQVAMWLAQKIMMEIKRS